MKYKIGDTVKLNECGIENFDNGEDLRDHLLKIEGINKKADYPYLVRCSNYILDSPCSSWCSIQNRTLHFNGSCFAENELELAFTLTEETKKEIMIENFKKGDRIHFIGNQDDVDIDDYGCIVEGDNTTYSIGVEFDNQIPKCYGHTCKGKTKDKYGFYISSHNYKNITKIPNTPNTGLDEISKLDAIMDMHCDKVPSGIKIVHTGKASYEGDLSSSIDRIKKRSKKVGYISHRLTI